MSMTKVGSLRASDADREQIVSRLHKAATEGRIGADELEDRVSAALKARTYRELDATVLDLPNPLTPRARRSPGKRSGRGWLVSAVRANPVLLLLALPVVAVTAAMVLAAMVVWAVTMVVIMVLGGRPRAPRGPWMYTRQRRPYGPPRRGGPRSYWA
jgi:Flp pilus assembly protein TadB